MRKEPYMKQMNRQQGFTLIELIVVIVILGILAVTAAPKFMNLTCQRLGREKPVGRSAHCRHANLREEQAEPERFGR